MRIPIPGNDTRFFEVEYIKGDYDIEVRRRNTAVTAEARAMSESIDGLWERYPVQPGETWRVGDALFLCGDIVEPAIAQQLTEMLGTERFIAYSSPPWVPGASAAFRDAVRLFECDFEDFVVAWANLVMDADAIYLQTTPTLAFNENLYYGTLAVCGQVAQQAWHLDYIENQTALLIRFSPAAAEQTALTLPGLQGTTFLQAPNLILCTYAPTLVFDPHMNIGFGALARAAVNNRHRFIGCDVRPRCMAAALAGQERITGIVPERIG